MPIGSTLRRLASQVANGAFERRRGNRRLTVQVVADPAGEIGFTLAEAGSRGWVPVVAGRVADDDEVTITFRSEPVSADSLQILDEFLAAARPPKRVAPLRASRERSAA